MEGLGCFVRLPIKDRFDGKVLRRFRVISMIFSPIRIRNCSLINSERQLNTYVFHLLAKRNVGPLGPQLYVNSNIEVLAHLTSKRLILEPRMHGGSFYFGVALAQGFLTGTVDSVLEAFVDGTKNITESADVVRHQDSIKCEFVVFAFDNLSASRFGRVYGWGWLRLRVLNPPGELVAMVQDPEAPYTSNGLRALKHFLDSFAAASNSTEHSTQRNTMQVANDTEIINTYQRVHWTDESEKCRGSLADGAVNPDPQRGEAFDTGQASAAEEGLPPDGWFGWRKHKWVTSVVCVLGTGAILELVVGRGVGAMLGDTNAIFLTALAIVGVRVLLERVP